MSIFVFEIKSTKVVASIIINFASNWYVPISWIHRDIDEETERFKLDINLI